MRACRANFSPIWGLYREAGDATSHLWDLVSGQEPDVRAVDREGAEHAVWRCTDRAAVARFHETLADEPVYVADGHHRYTTALQYRQETAGADPNAASNFVMAHLVRSTDQGLPVTGIHRIVRTDGSPDAAGLRTVFSEWFDLEDHAGDAASLFARLHEPEARRPAFGVFSPRLGITALARLKVDRIPSELAGDHSEAWRTLDAAALHTLAIDRAFAGGTQALLESGRLTYAYGVEEVERSIQSGPSHHPTGETSGGDLALFLAGTPVEQVLAVADAQDRMPEKSTYFYPKPVTGIVFASLSGEVA
jgi:uncharacterized protein (DUF1015 family)